MDNTNTATTTGTASTENGAANGHHIPNGSDAQSGHAPHNGHLSAEVEQPRLARPGIARLKPYIPGKPISEVRRELGLADDLTIHKLASNENVLGPSPRAVEAMQKAAAEVWLYPDDTCFDLKNALAQFHGVTPEHLIIGNGSDEVIHFLALALLDRESGDEVIFGSPSFVQYKAAADIADVDFVAVPLTPDMRHDLPAIKAQVNERTKLIFIAQPNNPTGTALTHEEVTAFLDGLPPRVVVVLDEAYQEFVDDPNAARGLDFVKQGRNVLVMQTFSKAYALAGLRVGYGIAPPALTALLSQVRGPFNVNSLAQVAAIAALGDQEHVQRSIAVNAQGREEFYAAFEEMGLTYIPSQANFVLVDTKLPAKDVFSELLKRGVIVRTGDPFGLPTWLRVTVGTPEMNARFISSLREILAAA